ncbi:TonB system transport protein TonB, partial [Escherichia coli]|nr:TonB system transport protein TonB [Escherichia coli]
MTLDLPRRFPWPTLLSVCIHGAVVAGLLYTSVHQVIFINSPAPPQFFSQVGPVLFRNPQHRSPPPPAGGEPESEPQPPPPTPQKTNTGPEK